MTVINSTLPAIDNLAQSVGYSDSIPAHAKLLANMKSAMQNEVGPSSNTKYSPDVVFNMFVNQKLSSDGSCRQAVADAIANGIIKGKSLDTGAYCHARSRLPESLFKTYTSMTHQVAVDQLSKGMKKWRGLNLKAVDGTSLSMPDTSENQQAFPQPTSQEEGIGFPILRLVVVFCLATACVISYSYAAFKGKMTGEHSLFRNIMDVCLNPSDLILGDAYYPSYWVICALISKGAHGLFEYDGKRKVDFRKGKKLGSYDHIVQWEKPRRPEWMSEEEYNSLPNTIQVREFKCGKKTIVTTLLDNEKFSRKSLGKLYTTRWCVETDIGALKTTMEMDILRCKTPHNISLEIGAHMVAYNLIRCLITRASKQYGRFPREISHKGAMQLLHSFKGSLLQATDAANFKSIVEDIIRLLFNERVYNRPGRSEPRAVKRRPKPYPRLHVSRRSCA